MAGSIGVSNGASGVFIYCFLSGDTGFLWQVFVVSRDGNICVNRNGIKKKFNTYLALLVVICGYFSYQIFIQPKKRPFKQFASYVKSELKEGDYLINFNGKAHHLWETKYYGIPAPIYVPVGELPLYVGTAQMTDEDILKSIPEDVKRVGAVTSEPVEKVEIEEPWVVREYKEFGELKIIWFEKEL